MGLRETWLDLKACAYVISFICLSKYICICIPSSTYFFSKHLLCHAFPYVLKVKTSHFPDNKFSCEYSLQEDMSMSV